MSPATGGGWDTGKVPLVVATDPSTPAFSGFSDTSDRTPATARRELLAEVKALPLFVDNEGRPWPYIEYAAVRRLIAEFSNLCPHDLDLRLHARCYLCEPEVKETPE